MLTIAAIGDRLTDLVRESRRLGEGETRWMRFARTSGILLHITSLPGGCGIGDLGPSAYRFADFLASTGQGIWEVLPLGPTGYGDSPYQTLSAFAGNPSLISLDQLVEDGALRRSEVEAASVFPEGAVDYGRVIEVKGELLRRSYERFQASASATEKDEFHAFCEQQAGWLDDFALFMAVKQAHGGASWNRWERAIALRQAEAMSKWQRRAAEEITRHRYYQYLFFRQWAELRRYCHERGIRLMGDLPLFVAYDSADVWAHRDWFELDEEGRPVVVAGVPPDYFSPTGQLWGHPLYRWEALAETGYRWWIERVRAMLELVDIVRLDHFRGFEAYWEVPAGEETAIRGRWVKGPGMALFERLRNELGELPFVAENLGVITPEVEELREACGFPGMAVLQFAFDGDPHHPFLPHNHRPHLCVYTGTHDNDTIVGWWRSLNQGTRSSEAEQRSREFAARYLNTDGREIHWVFIRAALASVADLAIIPLQDILGLGSEARMNRPASPSGNWRWRFLPSALTEAVRDRLAELTWMYGRWSGESI